MWLGPGMSLAAVLLALVVALAPDLLVPVRGEVLDWLGMGLQLTRSAPDSAAAAGPDWTVADRVTALEEANRRLELHAARLQQQLAELKRRTQAPLAEEMATPLLKHQVQTVQVLGSLGDEAEPIRQQLLNLGKWSGLRGEELLVQGNLPMIDRGEGAGVVPDALLLEGQSLWGRVVQAGRWTSAAQPMSDPQFRIAVRLVRASPQGPVFGARGLLQGEGGSCSIRQIPASEPVLVGDHVYTDSPIAAPVPLYCGTVAEAELGPHDSFWKIRLLPATQLTARQLLVLQPRLNLERTAAAPSGEVR